MIYQIPTKDGYISHILLNTISSLMYNGVLKLTSDSNTRAMNVAKDVYDELLTAWKCAVSAATIITDEGEVHVRMDRVTYAHYNKGVLLITVDTKTIAVRTSIAEYDQFLQCWNDFVW